MHNNKLVRIVLVLALVFGVVAGLIFAASFLKPLALALLIALLLVPVARRLEKAGMNRFLSCLVSDLIFVAFIAGLVFLLSHQVQNIASDWDRIQQRGKEQIEKVQTMVVKQVGVSEKEQEEAIEKAVRNFLSGPQSRLTGMLKNTIGSFGDLVLVAIYILLFLYYRHHFAGFIHRLVPEGQHDNATDALEEIKSTAANYLGGRLILIFFLAIIYGIGFFAFSVPYAFFYAVFAALLSLIPYLGNAIGVAFPMANTLLAEDPGNSFFGVLIVFAIAQFIESYLLEPLIVGKKVHINPFFTILIVVLGGAIWGVVGMMVAIPYLGMLYVAMNHTSDLKPYAFLIGGESESDTTTGIEKTFSKLKNKLSG
ncbi:AI-2E family transporter [Roseivirga sp. BDSF3-8]|uniref:AI-2E family transporter n=1 Tax=Roseivirga sp. BDSF3-8 TaxID=3241598 RepID=UPI0035320DFC